MIACGPPSRWTTACSSSIGGGWSLPPSYPNFCTTWIEIVGTEGAVILDDTHRDDWLNTVEEGMQLPMSTMPGEHVDHIFAGPMGPETIHFLESVLLDRPVMVTPEHARMVMEAYTAADLSAETNEPVDSAAFEQRHFNDRRYEGKAILKKSAKGIGLAIIGAGRVGLFRGEVAARHPAVDLIGIAETNPERLELVARKVGADFVTTDYRELLQRPEVNAVDHRHRRASACRADHGGRERGIQC